MGTGFSIDTPLKVAKYGISSVISLVDDDLIEQMRKYYSEQLGQNYLPITKRAQDYRAERITAYLNLINQVVLSDFNQLKQSSFEPESEITKYFSLLSGESALKSLYHQMLQEKDRDKRTDLQDRLRDEIQPGRIDVNIMTKVDCDRYDQEGNPYPPEFSDALSALRGYAQSTLESAVVFSAGFNRRLYNYVSKFNDFFADTKGRIKKKIVLKVSDYRSSLIQGSFMAQKGLWVSEYRIESGLNCGGHTFPTPGLLLGPILEEFKNKKNELKDRLLTLMHKALKNKQGLMVDDPPEMQITVQGGIGTAQEDCFMRTYYQVNRTGWATPFLLCPDVVSIDQTTLERLKNSTADDLYLSDISPLGVTFANMRNSLSEEKKKERIQSNLPGSSCPKGYLKFNTEYTKDPVCTASRVYQNKKIEYLKSLQLDQETYDQEFAKVVVKACICQDLGAGCLITHQMAKNNSKYPAVCPGQNLQYFSKISNLVEMVSHIYGRINLLQHIDRPHVFINELRLYVEQLIKEIKECAASPTHKQIKALNKFRDNLMDGIEYYIQLFPKMANETQELKEKALAELENVKQNLQGLVMTYQNIFAPVPQT